MALAIPVGLLIHCVCFAWVACCHAGRSSSRLFIVRHAESTNNALWARLAASDTTKDGWDWAATKSKYTPLKEADPLLSTRGAAQVEAVGTDLAITLCDGTPNVHIYASAMRRTVQTALGIAAGMHTACGYSPKIMLRDDIVERGSAPNTTIRELQQFCPSCNLSLLTAKKSRDGPWHSGEKDTEVQYKARASSVSNYLKSEEFANEVGDTAIVMVSHAQFIDTLLKALFDMRLCAMGTPGGSSFIMKNAAIVALTIRAEGGVELTHFGPRLNEPPSSSSCVCLAFIICFIIAAFMLLVLVVYVVTMHMPRRHVDRKMQQEVELVSSHASFAMP